MSPTPDIPDEPTGHVVDDTDPGRVWRHGRLRRIAVWAALAAGPLGLFASCASARVPAPTRAHQAAPAVTAPAAQDPSGFAQLFVSLWLRTDSTADDAHGAALRALAPNLQLRTAQNTTSAPGSVAQCASVRSAQIGPGYWSVTVGCETDSSGGVAVDYYAVPVQWTPGTGDSGSLAVVAQPAAVAAPATAAVPQTTYVADAAPTSPLASTVGAFVTAYLAGQGDVAALLSPGTKIPAPAGALYAQVQIGQISVGAPGMDVAVPADGTTAEVWVQVTATDQAGTTWPLAYALRLRARAGRWEVAALEPGPALNGQAAASAGQ